MNTQKAKRITDNDWQMHKHTLEHLWLQENKKLKGRDSVQEFMQMIHNFSASESQYEAQFRKWKWSKNLKGKVWEQVAIEVHRRKCQGNESEVFIDGGLQPSEKVQREVLRHSLSLRHGSSLASTRMQRLPTNITIRTPISDETHHLTFDLPFHIFENHVQSAFESLNPQSSSWLGVAPIAPTFNPNQITYINDDVEDMDLDGSLISIEEVDMMMQQPVFDTNSWNSALTSILPKSLAEKNAPGLLIMSPMLRRLFFSVANNFAGLGAFSTGDIIPYLQKVGDAKHYQMIHSAHGYSSRMITQNIFKTAIEAGSAGIVDLLLRQRPATIDVNKMLYYEHGRRYTPIERAANLQHFHVVEILLDHGAHVTGPSEEPHEMGSETSNYYYGTLDYAVAGMYHPTRRSVRLDHRHRIFKRLLDVGGDLTQRGLSDLIECGEGELAVMVLSANASKITANWCKWGLLRNAISFLDDGSSIAIINIMLKNGADLDYHAKPKRNPYYNDDGIDSDDGIEYGRTTFPAHGGRITFPGDDGIEYGRTTFRYRGEIVTGAIEAAALNGKLEISKLLLESGAQMTDDTLLLAVTSGNEDLIAMLLDRGANVNSIGLFKIPPLAAAIRTQNARVISMLEARGSLILMHDQVYCRAILQAATKAGNIPVIERLIQFECRLDSCDLGIALVIALENEEDEIAKILVDSGANVNAGSALTEAIKKRKETFILLLLDAGIDPNPRDNALQSAVEWGHTPVIKALILAGADPEKGEFGKSNEALTTAVRQQNCDLVQLLLDAGADIDNKSGRDTALSSAVKHGNFKTACYLLDHGADPHDSSAFEKAISQNKGLLELLLQRHTSRYPKGRPGFGSSALVHAIKQGDESSIKMMLANGIDTHSMVSGPDYGLEHLEVTPFWHAIVEKRHSTIDMLFAAGCNPEEIVCQVSDPANRGTIPRITAFVTAVSTLDISTIKLFLRHKADVNFPARGRVTRTPLQKAAELGDLSVLELLLNHGADVNAPIAHNGGATALQLAAIGGYFPVVCKLLALKADVNAPGAKVNGRSALEGAAEHGRLDMVQLLLNAGAGTGESGKGQVKRAIELADENGHFPICDLLRDHFHLGG